jgi:hypothetical protein
MWAIARHRLHALLDFAQREYCRAPFVSRSPASTAGLAAHRPRLPGTARFPQEGSGDEFVVFRRESVESVTVGFGRRAKRGGQRRTRPSSTGGGDAGPPMILHPGTGDPAAGAVRARGAVESGVRLVLW